MASFFCYYGRLSSAQLDRWQAPKQRPIINQTAYRRVIKDNGYKFVFTNSWLVCQRNRSWIKGWGKNPQKCELIHWRRCLLSGATELCPLEKHLHVHVYTSSRTMSRYVWRVKRSADPQLKRKLRVYTASDANWLNTHSDFYVCGREPYQRATRVHVVTVRWSRTEGTANNERVHYFCWFLPNPFIQDLFLLTYQPRNCKDGFISIVTRPLISLWYAVSSTGRWFIIGRCVGACQTV